MAATDCIESLASNSERQRPGTSSIRRVSVRLGVRQVRAWLTSCGQSVKRETQKREFVLPYQRQPVGCCCVGQLMHLTTVTAAGVLGEHETGSDSDKVEGHIFSEQSAAVTLPMLPFSPSLPTSQPTSPAPKVTTSVAPASHFP